MICFASVSVALARSVLFSAMDFRVSLHFSVPALGVWFLHCILVAPPPAWLPHAQLCSAVRCWIKVCIAILYIASRCIAMLSAFGWCDVALRNDLLWVALCFLRSASLYHHPRFDFYADSCRHKNEPSTE